jgi:hypothetical protein
MSDQTQEIIMHECLHLTLDFFRHAFDDKPLMKMLDLDFRNLTEGDKAGEEAFVWAFNEIYGKVSSAWKELN